MAHDIKKICVVTGSRAEYGLFRPILKAIQDNKGLSLQLVATGMHLLPEFGQTIKEIKRDGFFVDKKVPIITTKSDTSSAMSQAMGKGVIGMTRAFEALRPDIVFLLGDRVETFAAASAAAIMNIPIAHSGGGASSGSVDNSMRHAISKLAHIHFAINPNRQKKLKQIGEEPGRIHLVGEVVLDAVRSTKFLSSRELEKTYSIKPNKPTILAVFHPDTFDVTSSLTQTEAFLNSLSELGIQTILLYPNADAGGRRMVKILRRSKHTDHIKLFTSLPQKDYYSIMQRAKVMVGNSSSGFNEAPAFHLPVVNIGERQKHRDNMGNVVTIPGNKKEDITRTIKKLLTNKAYYKKFAQCKSLYGNGNAAEKIADILSKIVINKELFLKQ